MSLFTEYEFSKCVKRYHGDRHEIKFNCRDHFLVMSFAQFTNRSGLRDIETTLDLCSQDLYRSGLKIMPKSTLAELYRERWQIEIFFKWIKQYLHIKNLLRYIPKCCLYADMDSRLRLSAAYHREEEI
jgi:hypothetical protein